MLFPFAGESIEIWRSLHWLNLTPVIAFNDSLHSARTRARARVCVCVCLRLDILTRTKWGRTPSSNKECFLPKLRMTYKKGFNLFQVLVSRFAQYNNIQTTRGWSSYFILSFPPHLEAASAHKVKWKLIWKYRRIFKEDCNGLSKQVYEDKERLVINSRQALEIYKNPELPN